MNRLQSLPQADELCVTLNHQERGGWPPVIRHIRYDHPVYTPAGLAAQFTLGRGERCEPHPLHGTYWGYGFHEDGVVSALRVCERLRGGPWLERRTTHSQQRSTRARCAEPPPPRRGGRAQLQLAGVLPEATWTWTSSPQVLDQHSALWWARGPGERPHPSSAAGFSWAIRAVTLKRGAVLDAVEERTGERPDGPRQAARAGWRNVRALVQPDQASTTASTAGGEGVRALAAEVTNTPWGERHT